MTQSTTARLRLRTKGANVSSEHTKEPWHLGSLPPTNWRYLCDETGDTVAAVAEWEADGTLIQEFKGAAALANARRIVACVNFLEGISTDWLESHAGADKLPRNE